MVSLALIVLFLLWIKCSLECFEINKYTITDQIHYSVGFRLVIKKQ